MNLIIARILNKMKKTFNLICTLFLFSLTLNSCGVSDEEKIVYNAGYERGKDDVESKKDKNCTGKLEYMALRNMAGNQEEKKKKFCQGYDDGYENKKNSTRN